MVDRVLRRVGVTVAYRVMHAPWSDRAPWLARIRRLVPSSRVVEDERHCLWDTARRAWLDGAASGTSHVMVLQDDMLPTVDDFEAAIARLVTEKPHAAVSVFSIPAVLWAQEIDYGSDFKPGWRACGPWFWGGSVVMPSAWVPGMIAACDGMAGLEPGGPPDEQIDDVRIRRWAEASKVECAHWYPQLLEHVGAAHSLIGNPDAPFRRGLTARTAH